MSKPSPRKPRLSPELLEALLPPPPSRSQVGAPLPSITIQAPPGATVTVVVTPAGGVAKAD